MKRALLLLVAVTCLPACPAENVVLRRPGTFVPTRDASTSQFIILPAVDQRPKWEKEGDSPGVTLRIAGPGAAMFWWAGADVIADQNIVFGRNRYRNKPRSAHTMVSSDLGAVLIASTRKPVAYWNTILRNQRQVAAAVRRRRFPEGAVIVLPVLDHLTRVKAKTKQSSATSSTTYSGNYRITTTTSRRSSQTTGPVWSVMMRIHVFQISGGRIARHLVRYAAASSARPDAYAGAVVRAAKQVVFASGVIFKGMTQPVTPPGQPLQPPGGEQPNDPEQQPDKRQPPGGPDGEQPAPQPQAPPTTNPPPT